MAKSTSSEKRRQRSDARDQRRSLAAEPFEALDEAADTDEGESVTSSALKHAAMTAAAGAVAAGLAGAAKALADRRNDGADEQRAQESEPEPPQPDAQPEPEPEDSETENPPAGEEEPEALDEPERAQDDPESGDDADEGSASTPQGASSDEITEVVEAARRKLEELLGMEPERVSGFAHSNGCWTVTLEVLEVRRVPETTDVLSSYEVVFDDDRNLVSMSEVRRYRRSQIEEGR